MKKLSKTGHLGDFFLTWFYEGRDEVEMIVFQQAEARVSRILAPDKSALTGAVKGLINSIGMQKISTLRRWRKHKAIARIYGKIRVSSIITDRFISNQRLCWMKWMNKLK